MAHAEHDYTLAELEAAPRIDLEHFSKEDAFDLGVIAGGVIQEWSLNLAFDIVIGDDLVFRAKFGKTGAGNDPWLAGKAATARHFGEPSLLVRRRHEAAGTLFTDRTDIDHDVVKAHGGSIPIFVRGELVATATMSGEPDVVDHEACAEAISRYRATL
ncbi:heme-binding protein [Galbitalea soli]|uniref:Heme-degrading domain-containing protein n=1 Tax=Galbitalea soli TaxID=1268042 RepID=A0A7C9TQ54_9MICO|nr:hypothetical protein [Galbitalea soli]NYJ30750.1 uncharacterized protein (UPF0303 family) [Galbitalea soli]